MYRRDEPVAAARYRDDKPVLLGTLAEKPAQGRNMLVEVVLLDDDFRPDGRHERGFVEELARVLKKEEQRIECPGTQR